MHIRKDPSFFFTKRTGAPHGETLGRISPLSKRSCNDDAGTAPTAGGGCDDDAGTAPTVGGDCDDDACTAPTAGGGCDDDDPRRPPLRVGMVYPLPRTIPEIQNDKCNNYEHGDKI